MSSLSSLVSEVESCTICEGHLPLGPRPTFQIHSNAKLLIVGQAPGRKAHETGIPFNDPSGDRLRNWLNLSRETFYDAQQVAILPMGFCYPGTGKSGDLPPRPECAPAWRAQLLANLPNIELTVVLGQYAQAYHFKQKKLSVTALVKSWRDYWPSLVPLPHPSPRNNLWLRRNPWFEKELIPALKQRVSKVLNKTSE